MKLLVGFFFLSLSSLAFADTAGQVQISEPFARSTTVMQKNSAVFMTLKNSGADSAIVAATSPVAEVVELHTHTMDDGVMRMRKIDKIDLPEGEDVMLKPGGLHVMLIGLKQALEVDTEVSVTLEYADGSTKSLMAPVVHVMRGHGHSMSHGDSHGMKHDNGEGHGKGGKDCHGKHGEGHGKGHGEGHGKGHGEGKKHKNCHGKHHGKDYEHGEGKHHGNCHGKHQGKGHGEGHGKSHGEGHGKDYDHGDCHGESHSKGQMNHE